MAESHRAYTHAFLLRRASQVRQEYVMQVKSLGQVLQNGDWVKSKSAEEWLSGQPLMRALDGGEVESPVGRIEASIPLFNRFPIAAAPMVLGGVEDWWFSYSLDVRGAARWRWKQEGWTSSLIDGLSEHYSRGDTDPLTATLKASKKIETLISALEPHTRFLAHLSDHVGSFSNYVGNPEDVETLSRWWSEAEDLPTTFVLG